MQIRDRLLSIPIPSNTNLKDCVAWSSSAGVYKPKAAYTWLLHRYREARSDVKRGWLIHLNCLEKIRTLTWLVFHGSLPTNHLHSC
jgi:hypothetical protein